MDGILSPTRTIILSGLILAFLYFFTLNSYANKTQNCLSREHGCRPCPKQTLKDPFLGLDVLFDALKAVKSKTFLQSRRQLYLTYGNTYSSRLSTTSTICTIDPENFKALLATNFKDYAVGSPRRDAFFPFIGNSVLLLDGPEWEHSRALLRPSFSRSQIADLGTLEAHVHALIDAIPNDGTTVDLGDLFTRFTADVTTAFLFGESIHSLSRPDAFGGDLCRAFKEAQLGGEKRFRLGKLAMFAPQTEFYRAVEKIHEFMNDHVDRAIRSQETQQNSSDGSLPSKEPPEKENRYIFLHELAKVTADRSTLRSELLGIFVAGRDTTSALLGNLFFVLSRNPRVFQRLHEEIAQLKGTKPSWDDLKGMEYLSACINETLRLYPIVQGSSRVAVKDTILPKGGGGNGTFPVLVPKGTLVIYHYFAMHQREDLWGEDAGEFRPERWGNRKSSWDFVPFGGGPRNCIGQQLALLEAKYTTVRLLQNYTRIEPRDPHPWTESMGATVSSANGVKVALFTA